MSVIGPLELQLLVNSAGFKQQLARETSAGMAEMNRVVKTAVTQADKEFTGLGANAGKTLSTSMKAAAAETVKAFRGTGDKITAELVIDGEVISRPLLDAADDTARLIPREFEGVDREIARQLDTGTDVFRGVADAAALTADRIPNEFTGTGSDIARVIDREVDAANISTDVEANVQVDRSTVAADISAAVDSADVKVQVDTTGIASDVNAAVESARPSIRVDEAGLTTQIERGIERAGNVPLNLSHLTDQVRQAVQQGVTGGDASVDVGGAQRTASALGGLTDTSVLRDFSIAAAADRLDDSTASQAITRATIDAKQLGDTLAKSISTGAIAGIRVSAPKTLADEVAQAVEKTEFRPRINAPKILGDVKEAVNQADIKLFPRPEETRRSVTDILEEAARNAGVRLTVDKTDLHRQIVEAATAVDLTPTSPDRERPLLGADERAAIKITPDYAEVARGIEQAVERADIKITPDYNAVADDLERAVNRADINVHRLEEGVRSSILQGVNSAVPKPVQIGFKVKETDFAAIQAQAEKELAQTNIKIRVDKDRLGQDIDAIRNSAHIRIGVQTTEADRQVAAFISKLRAASDIDLDVDTDELLTAFKLAERLDKIVAEVDVTTDKRQLEEAFRLATSLESFAAQIDLRTNGLGELQDALRVTDALERIATVSIAVKGTDDLREASRIADDLEKTRTVPIAAQAGDLIKLDNSIGDAGKGGADKVEGALSDIDFASIGDSALDQLTGAIGAAGPWAAAAAGIGALFGDEFLTGFNNALPTGREDSLRALRFNFDERDMAQIGQAGGAAISSGLATGLSDAKDVAATLKKELGGVDDELDLDQSTKEVLALSQAFKIDATEAIRAAGSVVKRDLADNTSDALQLLLELGQTTGLEFGEVLELVNEFGPAVSALGIQGAQGFSIMAEMVERRLTPQIDQAGEIFEELNETIITGGAAEYLGKIGFNAEDMQQKIAGGGPQAAQAVADISNKILGLDSDAEQAAATAAIFGGNMGLMGDDAREATLELFATATATDELGTSLKDGVKDFEDAASGLDRLKLVAVDLGNELGTKVADGVDTLDKLSKIRLDSTAEDWKSLGDSALGLGEAIATGILGPLGAVTDALDIDLFGPLHRAFDLLGGDGPDKAINKIDKSAAALRDTGEAGDDAADGLTNAEDAVKALDGALDAFAGRFDADALMRQLKEDTDSAVESVAGLTGASYDLGAGFNISTEAGREAESALEDLSLNLDDMIGLAREGKVSSDELAAAQGSVRETLQRVASQMGLTQEETQELINRYGSVPDDVYTNLRANDYATSKVTALQQALANIKDKTVTISAKTSGPVGAAGLRSFALGGLANQPSIFGEDGLELALPLTKPERLKELLTQYGPLITEALGGRPPTTSVPATARMDTDVPWYQPGRATPGASPEVPWYQLGRTAGISDSTALTGLYKEVLGQAANQAGTAYWEAVNANQGPAADTLAVDDFLNSPEAKTLAAQTRSAIPDTNENAQFISDLYRDILGRTLGDTAGAAYWNGLLDTGKASREEITAEFLASPEAQNLASRAAQEASGAGTTDAQYIAQLYRHILGRAGDETGISYWTGLLGAQGAVRENVAELFLESAESGNLLASTGQKAGAAGGTDAEFIDRLYRNILHRAGDESGRAYWLDLLTNQKLSRDDVTYDFWASTEARNLLGQTTSTASTAGLSDAQFIDKLYKDILGRAADEAGAAYWSTLLSGQAATREQIAASFAASNEAQSFSAATITQATQAGQSDADYISSLYQSILGRAADDAGAAYWTGLLSGGATTRTDVAAAFRSSSEALNLPKFAMGGLATKPSIAGEDGPELILPLTKPARLKELLDEYGPMLAAAVERPTVGSVTPEAAYAATALDTRPQAPQTSTADAAITDAVQALRAAMVALERAGRPNVQHNYTVDRDHALWQGMGLVDEFQ